MDSTAVLGRSSQCSGTRFVEPPSEATLTVYGCEGGSGTVELRAGSITGRLLDSITITVRTPTPTPTPVTPSGELSATKTSIVVGDEVTVSAVNVSPSESERVHRDQRPARLCRAWHVPLRDRSSELG